MAVRLFGPHSPPGRTDQEALAQQIRLVRIFNGRRLLPTGVRQRRQSNWLLGELTAQQIQNPPVNLVQTVFINPEEFERLDGDRGVDDVMTLDRGEVTHPTK